MPRYKLTLEYDGGPFVGWQHQENGPSVQDAVENAVAAFCNERVTIYAAGRTDAGVHALGQVVHFDIQKQARPDKIRDGLNYHLKPSPVTVIDAEIAAPDFHARFHAVKRHYLFRIAARRSPPTLTRGYVWHVPVKLNVDAMHEAAQELVGEHDFSTFRAAQCQAKSPVKTFYHFNVSRIADEIHLNICARSFLQHQVRSMAGTLKLVGEGKWTRRDLLDALKARDRIACGPVAPPDGLYLVKVDYE